MDRIAKFLKKLDKKESIVVQELIELLLSGKVTELDIKQLKGFTDIYRVRKGKIRIIFSNIDGTINIIEISHRNDNTYNKY